MPTFERTQTASLLRDVFSVAFPTLEAERGADVYEGLMQSWECVLIREADELAGAALLRSVAPGVAEFHFSFLPWTWGGTALRLARAFLTWIWQTTPYRTLRGEVDTNNRLAFRFIAQCGGRAVGSRSGAFRKRGRLVNVQMMEISRS